LWPIREIVLELERLQVHLKPLVRAGNIDLLDEKKIGL
jgi:Ni,Fe-hydrogenase III large subunit